MTIKILCKTITTCRVIFVLKLFLTSRGYFLNEPQKILSVTTHFSRCNNVEFFLKMITHL